MSAQEVTPEEFEENSMKALIRTVTPDYVHALGEFFRAVDTKREVIGMSDEQVSRALHVGFDADVAELWDEWIFDD